MPAVRPILTVERLERVPSLLGNTKISGPEIVWNPCHGKCHSLGAERLERLLTVADRSSTSGRLPRFLLQVGILALSCSSVLVVKLR